jgi:hypothetical protein
MAADRMSSPPIVGVPAFGRWLSGPSWRTICPTWNSRSLRIIHEPSSRLTASAVMLAAAVRKVM